MNTPLSMQREPVDHRYESLRARWHETRKQTCSPYDHVPFILADTALRSYCYDKAERIVAADRAKHPKARRNAPVPTCNPEDMPSRCLP